MSISEAIFDLPGSSGDTPHSLTDMLRQRASTHASQVAMKFLLDGEREETSIDYAELDRRARVVAALIQSRCEPGDRVLLLYAPGPDFVIAFFACLYAGVTAVPAYPPDPVRLDRTLPRLCSMTADAEPTALLTTSDIESLRDFLIPGAAELGRLPWIVTDVAPASVEEHWRDPRSGPDDLAFLQYTSGSTGTPKGVMLSHGNLLHNSAAIAAAFWLADEPLGVIWLPPYHDMGLIGGILQPVYAGFPVVLLSLVHMLQRPLRWLEAISRHRAMVSGGPNFAFDLCVRKSTEEQRAALDLSSWRVAFNGAEPVRPQTLRRFAEAFRGAGFDPDAFYPCYGLAEATLLVSGAQVRRPAFARPFDRGSMLRGAAEPVAPARSACTRPGPGTDGPGTELVSAGQPCLDTRVEIRDPGSGARLPEGRVGEIWVHGPGVSAGYWRRPALPAGTFPVDTSGRRWLRTGDLGTQVDGELYITGRAKDLIVLRGRNHYPQDIEATAEASSLALRPGAGAAFGVDTGAGEELVLVQEVTAGREWSAAELRATVDAVRAAIALAHGIPLAQLVLIKPGAIPGWAREYPASIGQRALVFLDALGDSPRYHVAWAARSTAPFEVPRLRRAIADLVARHSALRTGFEDRPAGLTAMLRDLDRDFAEVNAAGLDPDQLAALVSEHAEAPFDLARGRIFRARLFHHAVGDVLLLAAHHIAVDFWSLVTMTEELRAGYTGTGQGAGRPDEAAVPSMSGHAARQQRYLAGDRALADPPPMASCSPVRPVSATSSWPPRWPAARSPRCATWWGTASTRCCRALRCRRTTTRSATCARSGPPCSRASITGSIPTRCSWRNSAARRALPRRPGRWSSSSGRTRVPGRCPPGLALGLPGMNGEFGGIQLNSYPLRPTPPPFELTLVLAEDGTDLVGSWHFDPSAVASANVAQLAYRYPQVLAETVDALLAAGPDQV
jgi:acyl-CoA synthetase (AMP-forming)/AMP-acid ligase II